MPKVQLKYKGKPKKQGLIQYHITLTIAELKEIEADLIQMVCNDQDILLRWDMSSHYKNIPAAYVVETDGSLYTLPQGRKTPREVQLDDLVYVRLYDLEGMRQILQIARENYYRLTNELARLEDLWSRIKSD